MNETKAKRHVKIVCTLGPASSSPEVIRRMLLAGMDVARLNLAYGTLEEHRQLIATIRSMSQNLKLPTGILLDLPGLKRRAGDIRAVFQEHLEFASLQNADFIALSFISSVPQVEEVKVLLQEMNHYIPIIVKIEKARALAESRAILAVSDGLMVARGDLALEISIEKVPLAQKQLIKEANAVGKPVITATQMLESMVQSTMPTRAEATDVANATLDGSDALMLSEETAIGSHPLEATEMMARIVLETEPAFPYEQMLYQGWEKVLYDVNEAAARAACQMAHEVQGRAIIAFTISGATAQRVSRYRPSRPILAATPSETVMRRLSLVWGVLPVLKSEPTNLEGVFSLAREMVLAADIAQRGDLIVIVAGLPLSTTGSTNLLKIERV